MTLLTGLFYFYTKYYKNKKGLQRSIEALGDGLLPPKVTGTRWLAHLGRGVKSLLRTYLAYEAHLSTLSHSNPKAEGYLKMVLSKDLVCFTLFLQEALLPLMTLSLKLQKPNSSLAESMEWVHGKMDIIEDMKIRDFTQAREVLETGEYKGIKLRGNAILSYITLTLDGFQNSLRQRFKQSEVLKCTRITHLKNWPTVESL